METTEDKIKTMAQQSRQRLLELGAIWAKLGIDRTSEALGAATRSLEATRNTLAQWKQSLPSVEPPAGAPQATTDGKPSKAKNTASAG